METRPIDLLFVTKFGLRGWGDLILSAPDAAWFFDPARAVGRSRSCGGAGRVAPHLARPGVYG
jgi:hypothetical protein